IEDPWIPAVGEKLQLGVNAQQRTARWRFRPEIADEPVPRAQLNMTDAAGGAIHEHRTNRRGEWIADRQSFESVIADELLGSIPDEFGLRARFDNARSKQCVFYIMPASRARMRVGAFLCDGGSLHQSAVDVLIDLAIRVNDLIGVILRDDRNGFLFARRGLEAKPRIGLCCMAYGLLTHW